MHKSTTKCNKTLSKWCKNKDGASKIMDTLETYQDSVPHRAASFSTRVDISPLHLSLLFASSLPPPPSSCAVSHDRGPTFLSSAGRAPPPFQPATSTPCSSLYVPFCRASSRLVGSRSGLPHMRMRLRSASLSHFYDINYVIIT
jgi:hypothetical protein